MNKYAHLAPPKHGARAEDRRCVTKVKFGSEFLVGRFIERQAKKGRVLYPYNCPMCLGWHTTSTKPAVRA